MANSKEPRQLDLLDGQIIPPNLAIKAMRDSGYRNTAYALAELVDNAQQAGASLIQIICTERKDVIEKRKRSRLHQIAVLDDGSGMDRSTLRMALQFGNGTRLGDRTGIGRFGMGLPNASISQAGRVEVWTWQNGASNAIHTYLDVTKIEGGEQVAVPPPEHAAVPDRWRELSDGQLNDSGTLVVWSNLSVERLTWKSARPTLTHTEAIVGRIYRHFLSEGSLGIRLSARDEASHEVLYDRYAEIIDPMYLMPSPTVPEPFKNRPMFEHVFNDDIEFHIRGDVYVVGVRYSVATKETVTAGGGTERGKTKYGKHAERNMGVSVVRARREISLDQGWCIGYDPRERWWGVEVSFDPALDEIFGVSNNKQSATHFSELATTEWEQLAEDGETFRDVIDRLKGDGDPRGWLLELSDSLSRNLHQIRGLIRAQGAATRSSRKKKRHDQPDYLTGHINEGWKKRSEDRPIEGESKPLTSDDLKDIQEDLTANKRYSEDEAREIVELIKAADLKVVFLEADFPDEFQLFNVETKGSITEITFNRRHPAFDDIFGTVVTVDEDIQDMTQEEALEQLFSAVNASKIVFAAWARYEREAGLERSKALRKVRFDWGQIAARFLRPEEDSEL